MDTAFLSQHLIGAACFSERKHAGVAFDSDLGIFFVILSALLAFTDGFRYFPDLRVICGWDSACLFVT